MTTVRRQAAALDRDREAVERLAVRQAITAGNAARRRVFAAYREGRDPAAALRSALEPMTEVVTAALLRAHGRGKLVQIERIAARMQHGRRVHLARTPLEGAINFLRTRVNATDQEIQQLAEIYGDEVFDVMGGFTRSVEKSILTEVAALTAEGASVRKGVRRLGRVLNKEGVTPDNPYHLESIVRTETAKAYAAGRWNALQNPIAQELLWGFRYATVADTRVRPSHAVMEGVTLPKDDAWWQTNFPPNGWGCRCQAIELFAPPKTIVAPKPVKIDGETIKPEPDRGFDVNFGEVFGEQPRLATPTPTPTPTPDPDPDPDPGSAPDPPEPVVSEPEPTPPAQATPAPAVLPEVAIPAAPEPEGIRRVRGVAQSLDIKARGKVAKVARTTISQIDQVHAVPEKLPIVPVRTNSKMSSQGRITYDRDTRKPLLVELNSKADHPHLTMAHETGHLIDLAGIGPNGGYDSDRIGGFTAPLLTAIRRSKAHESLVRLATDPRLSRRQLNHVNYLLRPRELFARSYAQYIAIRAPSRIMRDELAEFRAAATIAYQWANDDFEEIARAFADLLEVLGWTLPNANIPTT